MTKNIPLFFFDIVKNIDIKTITREKASNDNFSIYVVFENPYKSLVQRREGFCSIICDGIEIHKDYVIFVINEHDVLTVKWSSLQTVSWERCSMDEYKKECERFSLFSALFTY